MSDRGRLIVEVSRLISCRHTNDIGLLWASDQLLAEVSTCTTHNTGWGVTIGKYGRFRYVRKFYVKNTSLSCCQIVQLGIFLRSSLGAACVLFQWNTSRSVAVLPTAFSWVMSRFLCWSFGVRLPAGTGRPSFFTPSLSPGFCNLLIPEQKGRILKLL
jgi:hypothetical protein